MSDAPERIWAWPLIDWGQQGSSAAGNWQEPDSGHEHYAYKMKGALYIRADLASPLSAAAMKAAAVETADHFRDMCGECTWPEDAVRVGANVADDIGRDLAAIPSPTPDALLAEAMKLPQIKALVEALHEVERCGDDMLVEGHVMSELRRANSIAKAALAALVAK